MRVDAAMRAARSAGVERLDAQLMLARALARPRAWVIAHDDATLDAAQASAWSAMLRRRAEGEPLAYVFGSVEFYGLELAVDARVLVPRSDTETLVDWALELLAQPGFAGTAPRVLDLGTGSGAIALALRSAAPQIAMSAVDASSDALAVARGNATKLGLPVEWLAGDWWGAVAGRRFDLAVSNPPYIAQGDAHLAALAHEPAAALVSGSDGLHDLRQIVAAAPGHLCPGAWLLLEHGSDQAPAVRALLTAAGFAAVQTRCDLAGRPRVSGARTPERDAPRPRVGQ